MTLLQPGTVRGTVIGWLASIVGYVVLGALVPSTLNILQSIGIAAGAITGSLGLGIVVGRMARRGKASAQSINLRYLTSTTEQAMLFLLAATGLSLFAPDLTRDWLAEAGIWFLFARLLFAIGHAFDPVARSIGTSATFYPTLVLLALALLGALT